MSRTNAGVVSGRGRVVWFDEHVGLGELADEEGRKWAFHCTAIADGSRVVQADQDVMFLIAAAGPGRWEARSVLVV